MADEARGFYGVQFHPEVTHTRQGGAILDRFVHEICGCGGDWNMPDYVAEAVAKDPQRRSGSEEVLLGLSGGRRLGGRRGAHPPRDRRPAHLRVRRHTACCA